jgi:ribonuclease P protein component
MDETDLPAQRAQARQDTRLPQTDVDESRTGGHQVAPGEGTPAPVGVTGERLNGHIRSGVGPIRSRRTYADLRRPTGRGRQGPVTVSYVERPDWKRSEVAYAVNRKVGNAVQRNLLRRRMRAILAEGAAGLPTGAYLVRSGPEGPSLEFHELKVAMSQALEKATNRGTSRAGATPRTPAGDGA